MERTLPTSDYNNRLKQLFLKGRIMSYGDLGDKIQKVKPNKGLFFILASRWFIQLLDRRC